ncbi:MAG TPA: NADH-quinone oxidoreductase subunit NuoG [Candidatus Acidoferrum sp.]|nr:NADH-quinone oxidoreductase subunit NuoG [Candidatus Acidoferrum sp.]
MAKITVDGKVFEVDPNNNLLEEILSHQQDLPYFCWHPSMGSVGSCRQCAVIEYANDQDQRGRQVMACMTSPRDGARYSIEKAHQFRAQAIESIMTSHPHDCPVCEEGGECHLQDMTVMSGHTYRRYDGKKATHTNQDLGPFIGHEMNRCITCYRCVRYYKDYAGGTDFGPQASHNHTYFGRFQDGPLESEFSGNLAEVCPTGVFTDKVFSKHYARKWDLQTSPSVCAACGVGCNTNPGERYGTLRRVVNRFNDAVNGYFLCDKGRFGTGYVNSEQRIRVSMTRNSHDGRPSEISPGDAKAQLLRIGKGGIGIGSPRASLEANYALRELVGKDNFYAGVSDAEFGLLNQVLDIYRSKPVHVASIKDIEQCDAVIVLGEDVTNTAARIALALRQSVKSIGRDMAAKLKLPQWHDAAIRNLAQGRHSPLYILSPQATRLDDIAKQVHIASAADSARIGFAIAHAIDNSAPAVNDLSAAEQALVTSIAADLKAAKKPLVVSGTSSLEPALLNAAANIATALGGDKRGNLALCVPEANSLGLMLLMEGSANSLGKAMQAGATNAIVLENDLYRRAPSASVDKFLTGLQQLAVLDSLQNRTGEAANLVLAAGTFAETTGTFINYEGRAQHFYATFKPAPEIRSSAKWLCDTAFGEEPRIHLLTGGCAALLPNGYKLQKLTPGADWNFAGAKAPRQHHRYSGRTALRAHLNVHEPKQEQDEDGIMNYSMEGVPPTKDATVFNSPWSPGWNSNQSLFKFQRHTGAALTQAGHGELLLDEYTGAKSWYPATVAKAAINGFAMFPLYHLFGSEELTAKSDAIQAKTTSAYIALNPADASKLGLAASDGVQVQHNGAVPYLVRASIAPGTVGVSVGLSGLNFQDLVTPGIALNKAANWQNPKDWRASNIIVSDAGSDSAYGRGVQGR